ncbi:transcriptional regulator [Streptomyces sp. NPDC007264]|uniref:transcriptional regulator n=1 Tax=Streptomyces sp. NPDC007264 TaxID=3364777 RepID=UPI0036DB3F23
MTRTARELLETTTAELAPDPHANRLLPLIARGAARSGTLAALALEQRRVIASDRRAFRHLAGRSSRDEPACAAFFTLLAEGEAVARDRLDAYAAACGADDAREAAQEPAADCQMYPAYVAWLALNGEPADVALALSANFAAWGDYCTTIAQALRHHYGYDDTACGFFDFFAEPSPELRQRAQVAVQEGLDTGRLDEALARRYGRLLQGYEARFWHALWELDARG